MKRLVIKKRALLKIVATCFIALNVFQLNAQNTSEFTITKFNPTRTIIKQNVEIPFSAVIKNGGDVKTHVFSELILPESAVLVNGTLNSDHRNIDKNQTALLNWSIKFTNAGEYNITLKLFNDNDTIENTITLNVTDRYWVQKKFFLSAWSPPSLNKEAYDYYSDANFELVLWLQPNDETVSLAEQYNMDYLIRAGSLLGEGDYIRAADNIAPNNLTTKDLTKLDGMIEQFKDRERVLGYYITDEPNAKAFPNLAKTVNYLREKDPTRLSFINLFPTYANAKQLGTLTYEDHIEQFLSIVKPEFLSYDHYHFFNNKDGKEYFKNLGIIRKWALTYDIPFCNIIQAIGTNGTSQPQLNWRAPTEAEHRWLVYSSLAYGAKGIVWFHWDNPWGLTGSPERDRLYASIKQLNKEINNIGDILVNLHSTGVFHTKATSDCSLLSTDGIIKSVSENADLVIGFFKDSNDKDYFMLMNKSYNDSTIATITLNGIADDLRYFNVIAKQWEVDKHDNSSGNTKFDVKLQPGEGKLFSVKTNDIHSNDSE